MRFINHEVSVVARIVIAARSSSSEPTGHVELRIEGSRLLPERVALLVRECFQKTSQKKQFWVHLRQSLQYLSAADTQAASLKEVA